MDAGSNDPGLTCKSSVFNIRVRKEAVERVHFWGLASVLQEATQMGAAKEYLCIVCWYCELNYLFFFAKNR